MQPTAILADLDFDRPTGRDDSGRPYWSVRCRVPFQLDCGQVGRVVRPVPPEARAGDSEPDPSAAGPRIAGPRIEGIASSTGRDFYGTEMTRECLDGMAAQFRSGSVAYLSCHPPMFGGGGEWDDIMGYVRDATVEIVQVRDASVPEEVGYALRTIVQLDAKHPKTAALAERVEDGHLIGQSIGGWFTKMRFVWPEGTDDDDKFWTVEPERMLVEEVELDHLAATRQPANADSWISAVRSAIDGQREGRAKRLGGQNRHPKAAIIGKQIRSAHGATRAMMAMPADACAAACDTCRIACEAACRACEAACRTAMVSVEPEKGCSAACSACSAACIAACSACMAACMAACASCEPDCIATCATACSACATVCAAACSACMAACMAACAAKDVAACMAACDSCSVACAVGCRACSAACTAACSACAHCIGMRSRAITDAPAYRPVTGSRVACEHCTHFEADEADDGKSGTCTLYRFLTTSNYVCDSFVKRPGDDVAAPGGEVLAMPPNDHGPEHDEDEEDEEHDEEHDMARAGRSALDSAASATHDSHDDTNAESDAHGGASEADRAATLPPEQEPLMDAETQARLDAIERSLATLTEALATRAAEPKPAATPDADARIAELEGRLQRALAAPVRRGLSAAHLAGGQSSETETDALLAEAANDPRCRSVAAVVRSRGFVGRRAEADGPAKVSKAECDSDIRSLLNAAEQDGLLGRTTAAWQ